ncbi:Gp19/Gp15/Gp42 family protein [Mycobacterium novum]
MTYASSADVAALLARELDAAEVALVDRRLEQVERMILRRIPDLADKVASGEIDQADVVDIEAEAVLRLVRNPDGLRSETDGTYTYQLTDEAADNRLRLTADEWQTLGIRTNKMFGIAPRLVTPAGPVPFYQGG